MHDLTIIVQQVIEMKLAEEQGYICAIDYAIKILRKQAKIFSLIQKSAIIGTHRGRESQVI